MFPSRSLHCAKNGTNHRTTYPHKRNHDNKPSNGNSLKSNHHILNITVNLVRNIHVNNISIYGNISVFVPLSYLCHDDPTTRFVHSSKATSSIFIFVSTSHEKWLRPKKKNVYIQCSVTMITKIHYQKKKTCFFMCTDLDFI